MSNVKKSVTPKKNQINESCEVSSVPQEPKVIKLPRKSRAKKIPTKEEALKLLSDTRTELKQIIQDLKKPLNIMNKSNCFLLSGGNKS